MNRQQTILLATFVALFFAMYFGCDYVPKNHKSAAEQTMASKEDDGNIKLVTAAMEKLSAEQKSTFATMEQQLRVTPSDTAKISLLKKLSGAWYRAQNAAASAYYAEKVATMEKTELAWKIAGSMYLEGIRENEDVQIRQICTESAAKAFENAISINPTDVENRINLALCFTENPPQETPMKGILMLIDLDKKNPGQPKILFQLAKLAMFTKQFEKAVERLEQILKKDPQNPEAICLITDAYSGAGNTDKAAAFAKKCESLIKK